MSYATFKRRLPSYATEGFTRDLSRLLAGYACIGRASLVLLDVTTLYFKTDKADGFRQPGCSKEKRLEPQITVGLLTDETEVPPRAGGRDLRGQQGRDLHHDPDDQRLHGRLQPRRRGGRG